MSDEISMLMDGELEVDAARRLVVRMKTDEGLKENWLLYHLVGDAIRDQEEFRADFHLDCCRRLLDEPTVLSPRKSKLNQFRFYALSAAASVAAVFLVGWVALQSSQDSSVKETAQAAHVDVQPSRMNDYLAAHQEFSPRSEMMDTNIRTISESYEENGR